MRPTPLRSLRVAVIALTVALASAPAVAAEGENIYGPAAPPQSAFLRLFNATPQPLEDVRFSTELLGNIAAYDASDFVFVPPGPYTLSVNGVKQTFTLGPNRYYTVVLRNGQMQLLDNERYNNRMKALVIVYNLLDGGDLSLRTEDGRTAVVDKVPPNRYATREVNAVKTSLALYRGNQRVAPVKPVMFERGRAFSLFIAGTEQQPIPVWVVN